MFKATQSKEEIIEKLPSSVAWGYKTGFGAYSIGDRGAICEGINQEFRFEAEKATACLTIGASLEMDEPEYSDRFNLGIYLRGMSFEDPREDLLVIPLHTINLFQTAEEKYKKWGVFNCVRKYDSATIERSIKSLLEEYGFRGDSILKPLQHKYGRVEIEFFKETSHRLGISKFFEHYS